MKTIELGRGVLTWDAHERRTDRYGAVYVMPEGTNSYTPIRTQSLIDASIARGLRGNRGNLVAVVMDTRQSTHAGDVARNTYPRTPKVGDRLVLGSGTFFVEAVPGGEGVAVGLRPDNPDGPRFTTDEHGFRALKLEQRAFDNGDGTSQVKVKLHEPWLDVRALYDAHEQSVTLTFEPETEA